MTERGRKAFDINTPFRLRPLAAMRRDPRLLQIATLSTFLALQVAFFDFAASVPQVLVTCSAALLGQAVCARLSGVPVDWRSPLITGLSLSLLLRTHSPLLWCCAGLLAVGSKFLIRVSGKHVFNPACFAIVALLLVSGNAWVSPAIWGAPAWFAFLAAGFGVLVLSRASRLDTALTFFGVYAGLLLARSLVLEDPLSIPLHQLQSGALLLFATFMITDPRSTPDTRIGRMMFAWTVAVLSYELQFGLQIREGLFYALILAAPLTPLIDRWRPARRFYWTRHGET